MQVIIDFGETRHIMLEVVSIKNDEFVISSASYVLRNEQTGEDETAGSCNIIPNPVKTGESFKIAVKIIELTEDSIRLPYRLGRNASSGPKV